jgi:hypothetical protein
VNTGAKIAIGCGVAALLGVFAVVVLVGGAAWFVKDKFGDIAEHQERIEEFQAQANAVPFDQPTDNVVDEERLKTFIEIRRRVAVAYEPHRDLLERQNDDDHEASLDDITGAMSMVFDIQLALAQAQAEIGMSEEEYRFLVEQVYTSKWAAAVADQTGGKSLSEAASGAFEAAIAQLQKSAEQEGVTDEQRAQIEEQIAQMRDSAANAGAQTSALDVPPANIELFRKYESDIEELAMSGLPLAGL